MGCSNCCDSRDINLPEGTDGVGISSVTLNGSNQFVINFNNGTSTTTSAVTVTATGTNILHHNTTAQSETFTSTLSSVSALATTTPNLLGTFGYTVPSGTVTTDGSEIRVTAWFSLSTSVLAGANDIRFYIMIDGAWFSATATQGAAHILTGGAVPAKVKVVLRLIRKSNTTVACATEGYVYYKNQLADVFTDGDFENTPAALGSINFTTTGILLEPFISYTDIWGNAATTQAVTCTEFMVEHYKK